MKRFETKRLIVRDFKESDIDSLYILLGNSDVMKYCSGPLDFQQSQKWLKSMISRDKWGKGYAIECGKACIKYAFEVLKMKRLYATVEKENSGSKRVLEKIGMRYIKDTKFLGKKISLFTI